MSNLPTETQLIKHEHKNKLNNFMHLYDTNMSNEQMALALDISEYDIKLLITDYEDDMGANDPMNYEDTSTLILELAELEEIQRQLSDCLPGKAKTTHLEDRIEAIYMTLEAKGVTDFVTPVVEV